MRGGESGEEGVAETGEETGEHGGTAGDEDRRSEGLAKVSW